MKRLIGLSAFFVACTSSLVVAETSRDNSVSLNTAVWQAAKAGEAWLREHNCISVAVLKFDGYLKASRREAIQVRRDFGPIHINVARRLERGLIVVQRPKDVSGQPQAEIVVAKNADAIAAQTAGADVDTDSGRAALSRAEFVPAWGQEPMHVDAIVTGLLRFESLQSTRMTLILLGFETANPQEVSKIGEFDADMSIQDLIDAGRSFRTRGIGVRERPAVTASTASLEQTLLVSLANSDGSTAQSAAFSPSDPVRLRILYNGVEQSIRRDRGELLVPVPQAGQAVELVVERQGTDRPRLGIIVKLNGENSYGRQRKPDLQCTKWILEPDLRKFSIREFQMSSTEAIPFRVATPEESRRVESQFGADCGTISLTVFGEQGATPSLIEPPQLVLGTTPVLPLPKEDDPFQTRPRDLLAIAEGEFSATPAHSRDACVAALRPKSAMKTRGIGNQSGGGLILADPGQTEIREIQTTRFTADPLPLLSVTVRYY